MCDPTFIAMSLISGMQSVQQYIDQREIAKETERFQNETFAQVKELNQESLNQTYLQLGRRALEEREQTAAALQDVVDRASLASASARVAAGEAGVAGTSVDELLRDFAHQEGVRRAALRRTQRFRERAMQAEKRAARIRAHQATLAAQPSPVAYPSFGGMLLQIGESTTGAFVDTTVPVEEGGYFGRDFV